MLTTLKDILAIAEEKKIAVGAFNTLDLSYMHAIIGAAEELGQPVIIMHAQIHEEKGYCEMDEVAPIMLMFAERAKVPVCVHLDHGTDLDYVKRGLQLGFSSVMYDGSTLPDAENTENTKLIVTEAKKYGASVEAEIGFMGAGEGGGDGASIYTEPDTAVKFVAETGIDALACAFGTAHGFYKDAPKLDFERLSEIYARVSVPIVMHGGSGVSEEDYREVIKRGVRKVNYYTYMAKAGADAVSNRNYSQFHDVLIDAEKAMRADVKRAISVFAGL